MMMIKTESIKLHKIELFYPLWNAALTNSFVQVILITGGYATTTIRDLATVEVSFVKKMLLTFQPMLTLVWMSMIVEIPNVYIVTNRIILSMTINGVDKE